jgi:DNA-binding transcriptional regulator GbsR (MarR family)
LTEHNIYTISIDDFYYMDIRDMGDAEMKQFIEDVGILYGDMGLPRMAGRIFGWLLLCEPPHQSAEQLATIVAASKGSISSMTRLLIQMGMVEKVGIPRSRGTYYRIRSGSWLELIRNNLTNMTAMRKLADKGLKLMAGRDSGSRRRLQELRDFHAFLEREIPSLVDRYQQGRTKEH